VQSRFRGFRIGHQAFKEYRSPRIHLQIKFYEGHPRGNVGNATGGSLFIGSSTDNPEVVIAKDMGIP
jgi:hypothetical protein